MSTKPAFAVLVVFLLSLPISIGILQPAFAAEPCESDANWSGTEQKVWQFMCTGEVADLTHLPPDQVRLRGSFLKGVLTNERLRGKIPAEGIRITGAVFDELTLDN